MQSRTWNGKSASGSGTTDCSAFVSACLIHAGFLTGSCNNYNTGNLRAACLKAGAVDVTSQVNLTTCAGMQTGDILLRDTGAWAYQHVEFYIANNRRMGAHGKSTQDGGSGGTRAETVSIKGYYNSPWSVVLRFTGGGTASDDLHWRQSGNYNSSYVVNGYSSFSHMDDNCINNAIIVAQYFSSIGYTKEAICGILGNWSYESGINPDIWNWQGASSSASYSFTKGGTSYTFSKTDSGYGLGQWTPAHGGGNYFASNYAPSDWMSDADANGNGQLEFSEWISNNGQWNTANSKGWSWSDFKSATDTPEVMAEMFHRWWEYWSGGADSSLPTRIQYAREWYNKWDDWYQAGSGEQGNAHKLFWLIAKGVIL